MEKIKNVINYLNVFKRVNVAYTNYKFAKHKTTSAIACGLSFVGATGVGLGEQYDLIDPVIAFIAGRFDVRLRDILIASALTFGTAFVYGHISSKSPAVNKIDRIEAKRSDDINSVELARRNTITAKQRARINKIETENQELFGATA